MTDTVRKFMIETLNANGPLWEVPGPRDTSVKTIQCWGVPNATDRRTRLVIVEIYNNGGFDVFAQIFGENRLDRTAVIVDKLAHIDP